MGDYPLESVEMLAKIATATEPARLLRHRDSTIRPQRLQSNYQHNSVDLIESHHLIEHLDFSTIEKKDKVAVKMHLGFNDGYQTVPVFFVRRIVEAIKKVGGVPFVTDNPTAVYNAAYRGYTQETCGCPIIPIAGVKDG